MLKINILGWFYSLAYVFYFFYYFHIAYRTTIVSYIQSIGFLKWLQIIFIFDAVVWPFWYFYIVN